jgi:hypothetical protein
MAHLDSSIGRIALALLDRELGARHSPLHLHWRRGWGFRSNGGAKYILSPDPRARVRGAGGWLHALIVGADRGASVALPSPLCPMRAPDAPEKTWWKSVPCARACRPCAHLSSARSPVLRAHVRLASVANGASLRVCAGVLVTSPRMGVPVPRVPPPASLHLRSLPETRDAL